MKTSQHGIALLHYFESCELTAYPDPGTGGAPWTIGWGHTGPEVKKGLTWTQEKADTVFEHDLAKFERGVADRVKVAITQGQFDALVSFSYNVGLAALSNSTLLRLLNTGDTRGARDQFARWNKAGGRVLKGLTRRRAAEAARFEGKTSAEAIAAARLIK